MKLWHQLLIVLAAFLAVWLLLTVLVTPEKAVVVSDGTAVVYAPPPPTPPSTTEVPVYVGPAVATAQAERLDPPTTLETTTTAAPVIVVGPPAGLSNCDEMHWFRVHAGLPDRFDAIGYRESNCRNEDGVHTFCCHGFWQLYISLWIKDSRLGPKIRACGVSSYLDVNSDTYEDKLRQACSAKAAYDVSGYTPWAL